MEWKGLLELHFRALSKESPFPPSVLNHLSPQPTTLSPRSPLIILIIGAAHHRPNDFGLDLITQNTTTPLVGIFRQYGCPRRTV